MSREGKKVYDFKPISFEEHVSNHLELNPDTEEEAYRERLRNAVEAKKQGKTCRCGNAIWAIGAATAGHRCFTCITGETDASDDYEIDEVCE